MRTKLAHRGAKRSLSFNRRRPRMRLKSHMVIPASFAIQALRDRTVQQFELFRQSACNCTLPESPRITVTFTLPDSIFDRFIRVCTLNMNDEVLRLWGMCRNERARIAVQTERLRSRMCMKSKLGEFASFVLEPIMW